MNDENRHSSRIQSNLYAFERERRLNDVQNQIRHVQVFDDALRINQQIVNISELYE
jgi:hypothetical protein